MEKSSTFKRITKSKTFTLVLVFILVVVVFTIIKPSFLRPVNPVSYTHLDVYKRQEEAYAN